MFVLSTVPNPNYRGQLNVARVRQMVTCPCGSTNVGKGYLTDFAGEVVGVRYSCRDCGAAESA